MTDISFLSGKNKSKTKKAINSVIGRVFRYYMLLVVGYIVLYPLFYMVSTAIKGERALQDVSFIWFPQYITHEWFSVAVEQRRKSNEANKTNQADFFPVVCFYGTAEFIKKYFEKGQAVTLYGSLQNRAWEEADGTRRHVTEILAQEAYFCGRKHTDKRETIEEAR